MVVATLSKKRLWQIALELIPQFRASKVEADVIAYNVGISACERSQAWNNAIELLDTMTREGLVPDEVSFNSMMSACGRRWACAVQGLRELVFKSGMSPTTFSFNSCLGACERSGQWTLANALFLHMGAGKAETDAYTLSSTMNACRAKPQPWLTALKLLQEMPLRKLVPNEIIHSSVMQACASSSQWKEVLHSFSAMRAQFIATGSITYNIAIRACASGACWQPGPRLVAHKLFDARHNMFPVHLGPRIYSLSGLQTRVKTDHVPRGPCVLRS